MWLAHAYLAGSQRSEVAPDEDLGVAAHRAVRSLERTAARLAAHYPDLPVAMFARCGTPVAVLGDIAAEAALVVVGRHSGGRVAEAVLGSVTPGRLPHPLGPVVAVPAQPSYVVREAPIIVGVGERGPSPAAVNFAFQQASVHDAPIRLVHCVRDSSEIWTEDTQVLAAVETYQRGRLSVRVSVDVLPGDPGELLVKESLTASLLVLGPGRGWGRCLGRVGPVGHDVLGAATCPVVLLRDPEPRRTDKGLRPMEALS